MTERELVSNRTQSVGVGSPDVAGKEVADPKRKQPVVTSSLLSVHLGVRGLGPRAHDQEVDVYVAEAGHRAGDRVRHVVRRQQLDHALVDLRRLLHVAAKRVSANSWVLTMPGATSTTRTGCPAISGRRVSAGMWAPCLAAT